MFEDFGSGANGQKNKRLKQSSTEAGWAAAQAGPCLAGVFQPMA